MIAALRPHFVWYLTLLALLALTATFAGVPLGYVNLPLSLAIGAAKAFVVAAFFMELKRDATLIRLAACVGLLWLTLFMMLVLTDYTTRSPGHLQGHTEAGQLDTPPRR